MLSPPHGLPSPLAWPRKSCRTEQRCSKRNGGEALVTRILLGRTRRPPAGRRPVPTRLPGSPGSECTPVPRSVQVVESRATPVWCRSGLILGAGSPSAGTRNGDAMRRPSVTQSGSVLRHGCGPGNDGGPVASGRGCRVGGALRQPACPADRRSAGGCRAHGGLAWHERARACGRYRSSAHGGSVPRHRQPGRCEPGQPVVTARHHRRLRLNPCGPPDASARPAGGGDRHRHTLAAPARRLAALDRWCGVAGRGGCLPRPADPPSRPAAGAR